MAGKYKRFKKPRYCPNASWCGSSTRLVSEGDLISYREYSDREGNHYHTRLARVLGLATHDGCMNKYDKPRLLVLATDDMLSFGMERHVRLEDVAEISKPGDFTRWFLYGKMQDPETTIRASEYGALSNGYVEKYLDGPEGQLRKDWHEIAMDRAKPTEKK